MQRSVVAGLCISSLFLLVFLSGRTVESRAASRSSKGRKAASKVSDNGEPLPVACFVCTSDVPSCADTYFVSGGTPTTSNCKCCKKSIENNRTRRICIPFDDPNAKILCLPNTNNYTCFFPDLCNRVSSMRSMANVLIAILSLVAIAIIQ